MQMTDKINIGISINHDDTSESVCTFCAFLHVSLYSNRHKSLYFVFSITRFSLNVNDLNLFICCCNKNEHNTFILKGFLERKVVHDSGLFLTVQTGGLRQR